MFLIPFRVSPLHASVHAVQNILSALLPTLLIFVTADFLNTAVAVYQGEAEMAAVYRPAAFLAGIMMYNILIGVVSNILDCYRNNRFRFVVVTALQDKATKLEYWLREDPYAIDLLLRADVRAHTRLWDVYANLFKAVNLLIFVTGILITLFTQVWWIALTIIVLSIPLAYIANKAGQESYKAERELSSTDRMIQYLSGVLTERESAEERAVFGYTESLNREYEERFEQARKFRLKVLRKNFIRTKAGGIVGTLYAVAVMLTLIGVVMSGDMDIGMFIALMGAVFALSNRMSLGLNQIVKDISYSREYLKDLKEFMELPEDEGATDWPQKDMTFSKIEFRNVRFKYPNTEKYVLDGVSFTLEYGRHYSFVGENGSGKTTIIKLLARLYTRYEGEILVDGRSLRDLTSAEGKGLVSVAFQDFSCYDMSLCENMYIANPDNPNHREETQKVLQLVGLSEVVKKLRDGIDTPLGKAKPEAVDLSGGEWQRVALARCVIKPAPLRILDEPTSSLDPISESRVYRNFEKISQGKTTVFISHRLGSTKLADVIYVLDKGQIKESGSHDELMARNGLYRKMFESQAEWYRDEGNEGEGEAAYV